MIDPNGMEAVFNAETGELEHATGKDAQNAFRGLQKSQQKNFRDVTLKVSGEEGTNRGYIREDKGNISGNIYEVPLYKATLTGTDNAGNTQSYDFFVVRVGVKNGKKQSMAAGPYNIKGWDKAAIEGLGGWQIDGEYFLHEGSSLVTKQMNFGLYMRNRGCISFCFANENGQWVGNAFDNFAEKVLSLSGADKREEVRNNLKVEIEEFTTEPAIKKVGTFQGTIIGTNGKGKPIVKYKNSFD